MKSPRFTSLISITLITLLAGFCVAGQTPLSSQSLLEQTPIAFTENQGQWDEQVLFRADARRATLWFTSEGVVHHFVRHIGTANDDPHHPSVETLRHKPDSVESMTIRAIFLGANLDARVVGLEEMEYKCNYFIGNDRAKWRTDVPNYREIVYEDIYSGIDLKYYSNGRQMEYDFIVSPGADLSQIEIQYVGPESVTVNEAGELVVTTLWGKVVEQRPVVYQESEGDRHPVSAEYIMRHSGRFGFCINEEYNASLSLIIDPVIEYSTYLGGSGEDDGIAGDASGCAYITGWTESYDFPTQGSFQATFQGGQFDAFIAKLNDRCCVIRGDYNHDGVADISDIVDWVAWAFEVPPGPSPGCVEEVAPGSFYYPEVDCDNSGVIDISDIVYWVTWSFESPPGPAPVPCP